MNRIIKKGLEKCKEKASQELMTSGTPTNLYLQNTDKEKGHRTRKSHMDHSECYRKWKIKIQCGEDPLQ